MNIYLTFKVLHIVALISWMAGMLYLPRLFVYHSNKNNSEDTNKVFCIMEYRLIKYIMNPAMIFTWIFGIFLLFNPQSNVNIFSFWFLIKILCVLVMSALHGHFSYCRKKLEFNNLYKTSRYFKIINEVPTVLLLIIVIMVIFRPYG